jgi:predicted dinucleotide-binding enzyme
MATAIIGVGNIGGALARDLTAGGESVLLDRCRLDGCAHGAHVGPAARTDQISRSRIRTSVSP